MNTLLMLALLCGVAYASNAYADGYGAPRAYAYTRAPEYFVTSGYGPVRRGHEAGQGQRSSALSFAKSGTAHGSLYAHDVAEAQESAAKARGYQYQYKEGHKYYQPKNLYSYSESGPIIGYEDVYDHGYDTHAAPAHDYGYAAPSHSYGYAAPAHGYGYAAPSHSYGYAAPTHNYGYFV